MCTFTRVVQTHVHMYAHMRAQMYILHMHMKDPMGPYVWG